MKMNSYYFFENLANKTRFDIIMCLREGPKSVKQICEILNEEQSKISHNLLKLSSCHILEVERKGKMRFYSLNKKSVEPLLKIVEEHVKYNCNKCDCYCKKTSNTNEKKNRNNKIPKKITKN